jgi:type VI secretion system VgrG family protein
LRFERFPDLPVDVIAFSGKAALNSPYSFSVLALADSEAYGKLQRRDLLAGKATLSIGDGDKWPAADTMKWQGMVTRLREGEAFGGRTFLGIGLGPALSALEGLIQNHVYLGKSDPDIVKEALTEHGGIPEDALSLRIDKGSYPEREFLLQKDLSLSDFVLGLLEREGIALFFDQEGDRETMVLSDSNEGFLPIMDGDKELALRPTRSSGLTPSGGRELHAFEETRRVPPKRIRLRDYDWMDPNRPLEVVSELPGFGRGESYFYGDGFDTEKEGNRLLNIRKEAIVSACETFSGESSLPGLFPGGVFTVEGHALEANNDRYLIVSASYQGAQAGDWDQGISKGLAEGLGEGLGEALSFTQGLPQGKGLRVTLGFRRHSVPYRPERTLPKPVAKGPVTAFVDGQGTGDTPEMDAWGRYKVLLPLDVSGRSQGSASSWIRKASPYVGLGYGQNFPLLPGAEVLLDFVDGDPARPYISGVVPNAETGTTVNSDAPNISGISTKGGGGLYFVDEPGSQGTFLASGSGRGAIGFLSGSPTKSIVQADNAYVLSTIQSKVMGLNAANYVGWNYNISASLDWPALMVALIGTISSATSKAADITESYAERDREKAEEGGKDAKMPPMSLTSGWLKIAETAMGQLMILIYTMFKQAPSILEEGFPIGSPRQNFINITANDEETSADFFASMENRNLLSSILIVLATVLDIGSLVITGFTEQKELDELETKLKKAEAGTNTQAGTNTETAKGDSLVQDIADRKREITAKKMSMGINLTVEIVSVISSIVTTVASLKSWNPKNNSSKGIVIANDESYVNIKSDGMASISASDGPVILESSKILLTDLLNRNDTDVMIPKEFVAPDVATDSGKKFAETNAVLLRGPLVKFLVDRALMASMHQVTKSEGSIRIIAAKAEPNPSLNIPGSFLDKVKAELSGETATVADPDANKPGIGILTKDNAMPVSFVTKNKDATIRLKQGEGASSISMSSGNITMGLKDNQSLCLESADGGKVTLSHSASESLTMGSDKLLLSGTKGKLEVTSSALTLEHPTKVVLKAGSGSLVTQEAGKLAINTAGTCQCNAQLVQIST